MQLTVSITLSEEDAHNTVNALECSIIDTSTNKVIGGFTWEGGSDSSTTIVFSEKGSFVDALIEVDIEIISENQFDYTLDVEVV